MSSLMIVVGNPPRVVRARDNRIVAQEPLAVVHPVPGLPYGEPRFVKKVKMFKYSSDDVCILYLGKRLPEMVTFAQGGQR